MRPLPLVLALLVASAPVAAQSSPAPIDSAEVTGAPHKSVALARVLAIVPGVGHGYAGEGSRGLKVVGGLLGISAVAGVMMAAGCVSDALDSSGGSACEDGGPGEVLGALAIYGVWGWSIYDAGAAARRTNARAAGLARIGEVPVVIGLTRRPTASGADVRAVKVGVRFRVR